MWRCWVTPPSSYETSSVRRTTSYVRTGSTTPAEGRSRALRTAPGGGRNPRSPEVEDHDLAEVTPTYAQAVDGLVDGLAPGGAGCPVSVDDHGAEAPAAQQLHRAGIGEACRQLPQLVEGLRCVRRAPVADAREAVGGPEHVRRVVERVARQVQLWRREAVLPERFGRHWYDGKPRRAFISDEQRQNCDAAD